MYIFIHTFRYTYKVQAGEGHDLAAVLVGAHGVLLYIYIHLYIYKIDV